MEAPFIDDNRREAGREAYKVTRIRTFRKQYKDFY